jgi:thiol-disulfide isomerase/thioredoxin
MRIGSKKWFGLFGVLVASACGATPPHLDPAGSEAYRAFLGAEEHRAFAVAPGGGWGWSAGAANADLAREQAVAYCQERGEQRCLVYAVDGETVFDAKSWPGLWAPYADAATAGKAAVGLRRGQRFPDLALTDPGGRPVQLADLRGQVIVLHFWGSWCGVCRKELPDMQRAAVKLGNSVRFVLVQVRETGADARRWLNQQAIRLPLYDSGARSAADGVLRLAAGGRLNDRELARAFPTTYVLDKHGLVLFSHTGAIHDWSEYVSFLRHASRQVNSRPSRKD